jgi:hypothetical protein
VGHRQVRGLGRPERFGPHRCCLVLADQFWTYGIDHDATFDRALEIVAGGSDLEVKRGLGLGENDVARRARVLAELAAKWTERNERPKNRRVLAKPEPFVFEVGDLGWKAAEPLRVSEARRVVLYRLSVGARRVGVRDRPLPLASLRGLRPLRRRLSGARQRRQADARDYGRRSASAFRRRQVREDAGRSLSRQGHTATVRLRRLDLAQPPHPDAGRGDRPSRRRRRARGRRLRPG